MKIFKVKTDTNNVQSIGIVNRAQATLELFTFDCEPRSQNWELLKVYISDPKTKPKNFYSMPSGILVFDESVLEVCEPLFEMAGEILPLQVERGPKLYLLNILECMNGLNYDTSVWDYYDDGTKGRILKYGFHPERVKNESTLFKIPETSKTDIFCFCDVKDPEDEFYHLYHKHKFTGLIFEEMYNSDSQA